MEVKLYLHSCFDSSFLKSVNISISGWAFVLGEDGGVERHVCNACSLVMESLAKITQWSITPCSCVCVFVETRRSGPAIVRGCCPGPDGEQGAGRAGLQPRHPASCSSTSFVSPCSPSISQWVKEIEKAIKIAIVEVRVCVCVHNQLLSQLIFEPCNYYFALGQILYM